MTLPKRALRFHRWISLACLAFWGIQALTGILIVFHWEMDDAFLPGADASTDLVQIEQRIEAIESTGTGLAVGSIWESGGAAGRFDLYVDGPESSHVVRINGAGEILRTRFDGERLSDGGWIETLVLIHHNLLSGDTGSWIVGISGMVLLTNIVLGLFMAWPRRGHWRQTLAPPRKSGGGTARIYIWHRALGLWVSIPAMLTVAAAVMLTFSGATEAIVSPTPIEAPAGKRESLADVGLATAVSVALARYPSSRLSSESLPSQEKAHYRIRLLQPGEFRRIYGTTTVYVSAESGEVTAHYDALANGTRRNFIDGLFPFHTGEMGGLPGRLAVMAIGIWLLTMIVLGFLLWRRRMRR